MCTYAQKTVILKNLWARPQMHIMFNGYTVSFTIRDINRALELLNETGDYSFGTTCKLDTGGNFYIELLDGTKTNYPNPLQPLIQYGVGCFLFTKGKVEVINLKHKRITSVIIDIEDVNMGENFAYIHVYDPKNQKQIFSGKMAVELYYKDMGIDYY